jgi:hypothetical protein
MIQRKCHYESCRFFIGGGILKTIAHFLLVANIKNIGG